MAKKKFLTLVPALFILTGIALAGELSDRSKASIQQTNANDLFAPMNINNIFSFYKNNGDGALNPYTGDGGFEIISANRGVTVFEEGLVFGGFHKGVLKVGGSTYNPGWQAGRIAIPGTATMAPVASDPSDPNNRLYRVRPDVNPKKDFASVKSLLDNEIRLYATYDTSPTSQSLYDGYIADWNNWPAEQGAPYEDVNRDGKYDPTVDIPGVPGADQTMWYVVNDLDALRMRHLYGSDPIGIEMQKTIWAYKVPGALGNTIFQKNRLINKSGFSIDSMFVGQWADIDIGGGLGFLDDFAGCDTTLNLGFTYNGSEIDRFFGPTPPAVGFGLVQGPIVRTNNPNDRAAFDGGYRVGYKNRGMTSYNLSFNSNNLFRDATLDNAKGAQEMYNLLNGLVVSTGGPIIDPTTGAATKFSVSGDPVKGTGWLDGTIAGPGDRRQIMSSGPFTMAAGDTQEVVVAEIAAQDSSRLSSVALLKYYGRLVRLAANSLFNIPKPPAQPGATIADVDHTIRLDWSDPASIQAVETPVINGYAFQGYNVYQVPWDGVVQDAKLIATFDLVDDYGIVYDSVFSPIDNRFIYAPVQHGNNQGIQRTFEPKKNYINDQPLAAGESYAFAVTAYSINPAPGARPKAIESMPVVLRQIKTVPATLHSAVGDMITLTHAKGVASATTDFRVVNPYAITGHEYEISCVVLDSTGTVPNHPNTKWQVKDKTIGTIVLGPTNNYIIDNKVNPVIGGIRMGFKAAPYYMPGLEVGYLAYAKAGTDINTVETMAAANWVGVNGGLAYYGGGFDVAANFRGSTIAAKDVRQKVEIRFSHAATQKAYDFLRVSALSTSTYQGFKEQPFTVWDVTDAATPRQLDFAFLEQSGSAYQNNVWAPGAVASDREYFYISDETYTAAEKQEYAGKTEAFLATKPMLYEGWFTMRDSTKAPYADGDVWRIVPTNFLTTSDIWTFGTASLAPEIITGVKNTDVVTTYDLMQNYPNPFNPATTINYQLPRSGYVKLKIFDLLGRDVATLVDGPQNAGRYSTTWNARNNPSGVYFYRLTADSYTMTKKLMLLK
jgi:hypothetical protein